MSAVLTEDTLSHVFLAAFFDHIGQATRVDRGKVVKKDVGYYIPSPQPFGMNGCSICQRAYFLFVETERGTCRVDVPAHIYENTRDGDSIVLSYQVGRYTGALKGKRL